MRNVEMSSLEPRSIRIVEDQWATFRHIIEAVAIVVAGIWAFYTFIYQEKIKPANEPASLDIAIAVHRLGRDQHRDILGITIHLHNSGKSEIDVAADAYNVWGEKFASRESVVLRGRAPWRNYTHALPRVSQRIVKAVVELRERAVGGRPGFNIILEPDAQEDVGDVIVLPRGEYDLVHAQAIAIPIKTSETEKVPVEVGQNKVGGYWLAPGAKSNVFEDDNDTDFALIP
jgi:hypothetical protein